LAKNLTEKKCNTKLDFNKKFPENAQLEFNLKNNTRFDTMLKRNVNCSGRIQLVEFTNLTLPDVQLERIEDMLLQKFCNSIHYLKTFYLLKKPQRMLWMYGNLNLSNLKIILLTLKV
jgi:hypothetical protein